MATDLLLVSRLFLNETTWLKMLEVGLDRTLVLFFSIIDDLVPWALGSSSTHIHQESNDKMNQSTLSFTVHTHRGNISRIQELFLLQKRIHFEQFSEL